jgi:uncharacterized protein
MFQRLHRLGLALFVAFAISVLPARAEGLKDTVPSITVVGHAKMEIAPDIAIISVAVVTERPRASEAATENSRASQALIDDIKKQGIDPQDIQTISVTLEPVYNEDRDPSGRLLKRTLRGYQARNGITIRVHAIDKAGDLVRQLIDSGANEFEGISFDSDQKEAAYSKLRGAAVEDALNKAKAYVAPIGLHLARVVEIAPSSTNYGNAGRYALDDIGSGANAPSANVPIEPGMLTLEVQVEVAWEVSP